MNCVECDLLLDRYKRAVNDCLTHTDSLSELADDDDRHRLADLGDISAAYREARGELIEHVRARHASLLGARQFDAAEFMRKFDAGVFDGRMFEELDRLSQDQLEEVAALFTIRLSAMTSNCYYS